MADIVIEKIFKHPLFTWGAANVVKQGDTRTAYLSAIKAPDLPEQMSNQFLIDKRMLCELMT
jgi:hypothetical protein